MAGTNPSYDPWVTEELLNRHQLNGPNRRWRNFVMDGLGLSDGGGLVVDVAAGFAYISGYEVQSGSTESLALADGATNYVFLTFDKVLDPAPPATSVQDLLTMFEVNTTGIAPANAILLGEVDTAAGSIADIRPAGTRFDLAPAQFTENIESNHNQIENLVIHKGIALPPAGAPSEEGQLFFRTTDKALFKNISGAWVELAAATTPPPPGAITVVNDEPDILEAGEITRVSPGMPGSVLRASGAALSEARAVGPVVAPIPPTMMGDVATVQGILVTAQFETGLALVEGDEVYLSAIVAGAATNIQPAIVGNVVAPVGIVWDATTYVGTIPADSKATIVWRLKDEKVVS